MTVRSIGIIGYLLCLCLFLFPCSVQAAETADAGGGVPVGKECKMTLSYCKDDINFKNLSTELYYIASISANGEYSPKPAFQSMGIDWNGLNTTDQMNVARTTLESHILNKKIDADFKKMTNQSGVAVFDHLKAGLYLVAEVKSTQRGKQYTFQSALLALPAVDENGLWQHHMAVTPKSEVHEFDEPGKEEGSRQFKVVKLWNDAAHQEKRPNSIAVEIFKDGTSYQIINLSEANNWSYSWTAPKDGAKWMVAERNAPAGYTVSVEQRDTAFVLTNTYTSNGTNGEKGPETGDTQNLLFYMMLFCISGMVLILLAIGRRRDRR